jgi:exosome complex component CSL4
MAENDKIVLPGEKIAVVEEFMPGEGTYESNGEVFASIVGKVTRDARHKRVSIKALNPLAIVRIGDVVYGTITDTRGSIVGVKVIKVGGSDRSIAGDVMASLHISKVSKDYTSDVRDALRIGDIIKAEVVQVSPSLQLITFKPNLGVVRAQCAKCRTLLEKRGRGLHCPKCDNAETRKVSREYDQPPI